MCITKHHSANAYSLSSSFRLKNGAKIIPQTAQKSIGNERFRSGSWMKRCYDHESKSLMVLLSKPEGITCTSSSNREEATRTRKDFFKVFTTLTTSLQLQPSSASASFPFASAPSPRQLELCLVCVLRISYWAQNVGVRVMKTRQNAPPTGLTETMKGPYLEARLGAKAALTGKFGGGANVKVYALGSLELKECLKDAAYWYDEYVYKDLKKESSEQKAVLKKQRVALLQASEDIVESLAAVVEFDGLDNLQDSSPRSSLALTMYNDSKAKYIQRTLLERTVVNCDVFVNCFGRDERSVCENYIKVNYRNEMPEAKIVE